MERSLNESSFQSCNCHTNLVVWDTDRKALWEPKTGFPPVAKLGSLGLGPTESLANNLSQPHLATFTNRPCLSGSFMLIPKKL